MASADRSTSNTLGKALAILIAAAACAGVATTPTIPRPTDAATVAATVAASIAATGAATRSSAPIATPRAKPTPTPGPAAVVDVLNATGPGWAMTLHDGALWIQVDPPVDAIVRIDVKTGSAEPFIPQSYKTRAGTDGLWAACCDGIVRIDPATGEHLVEILMDGAFSVNDAGVWILTETAGVQEVDPVTGVLTESIGPFDASGCSGGWKDFVVAFGSGWLACKNGVVIRIDIATGDRDVLETGPGAHTFAVTEDAIWVTNYQVGGSVSKIDAETNEVTTIPGVGAGIGITYGDGFIWASTGNGIAQIDPESVEIVREFPIGVGWFYELVWDEGIIWVSTTSSNVLKVDPYR